MSKYVVQFITRDSILGDQIQYFGRSGWVARAGEAFITTKEQAEQIAASCKEATPPAERYSMIYEAMPCGEECRCKNCGRIYFKVELESAAKSSPMSAFGKVVGFGGFSCQCGGSISFGHLSY